MTSSLWVSFMCQVREEAVRTENKSRQVLKDEKKAEVGGMSCILGNEDGG